MLGLGGIVELEREIVVAERELLGIAMRSASAAGWDGLCRVATM